MILSLVSLKSAYDKTNENFTSSVNGGEAVGIVISYVVIAIIFMIIFDYGAARLSYFYNMSTGNTGGFIYFWAILCFFFSDFYYPFYSFFLNPISKRSGNNIQMPTVA